MRARAVRVTQRKSMKGMFNNAAAPPEPLTTSAVEEAAKEAGAAGVGSGGGGGGSGDGPKAGSEALRESASHATLPAEHSRSTQLSHPLSLPAAGAEDEMAGMRLESSDCCFPCSPSHSGWLISVGM